MAMRVAAPVLILLRTLLSLPAAEGIPTRCVFLHGVGQTEVSPPTSNDTDGHWGGERIEQSTPFCTERVFVHQDTTTQGWDSEILQRAYCDAAVGEKQDGVIRDTTVFSHSMGNLILAGALYNKTCSFDNSSKWYSLSAPWSGSKAAQWVHKVCTNASYWKEPLRMIVTSMKFCDADSRKVNDAYVSLRSDYPKLPLIANMTQRVDGSHCGDSPFGVLSLYSAGLELLAADIGYGEWSDGIVGISSCILPGRNYSGNTSGENYLSRVNHLDSLCRNGDGYYDDRKPCQWLAQRGGADVVGILAPPPLPSPLPKPQLPEAPIASEALGQRLATSYI